MRKKIFVCFGEKLASNEQFDCFSKQLDKDGFEVHLFDGLIDKAFQPYDVLTTLESVWKDSYQDNDYYFLTDIKEFFVLTYRVYQQSFCQFVFLSGYNDKYDVEQDTIYDNLLKSSIKSEEKLCKPVFTDDLNVDFKLDFLNEKKSGLDKFCVSSVQLTAQKIYRFDGQCYLLEPVFANVSYINLDDKLVADGFKFSDIIVPIQLKEDILLQTEEVLELISRDMQTCLRRIEFFQRLFCILEQEILSSSSLAKNYYSSILLAVSENLGIYSQIYVNHFLLSIFGEYKYYKKFITECINNNELFIPHAYYAFMQVNALPIKEEQVFCKEKLELQTKLFAKICQKYRESIDASLIQFDKSQADKDAVIVMVNQFLDGSHNQSLYALELCKYLMEKQNKKVWLFNTCEFLTQSERVPLFNPLSGTIVGEYTQNTTIEFEKALIPYYQMITPMPDVGGIDGILDFFNEVKPALLINLSDFSVTAEVCSDFVDIYFVPVLQKKYYSVILNGNLISDAPFDVDIERFYAKNNVKFIQFDKISNEQNFEQEFFDDIWQKINN